VAESLGSHHRGTLGKLFEHPPSRNIHWRDVESLLETVGTVTREHHGKLLVTVGPEREILEPPGEKDVDPQLIVDVRRMLEKAGYGPDGVTAHEV
jgi:hypothetical protein